MKYKKVFALVLAGGLAFSNVAYTQAQEVNEVIPISAEIQEDVFKSKISYEKLEVYFNKNKVNYDVKPQEIDGKLMIPLRKTLETLGFKVSWDNEQKSADISKDAFFSTVIIGENSYFKHKMAPIALSSSPIIVDERTLVPVEFLTEIMGYGVAVEEGNLIIHDEEFASRSGYIYEVEEIENGLVLTVTTNKETKETFKEDETDRIIVTVLDDSSIVNRDSLEIGDYITVVHLPYMILIYPAQTSAQIIY